jgi:hypothetical protein
VSEPIYLFRKEPKHIFITPKDPDYRYELLCGHCEYPIAPEDPACPRCQRRLEECPICSRTTHTRAPRVEPDSETGAKTCPVCRVRRIPFGAVPLAEIVGSFCTNAYGCPAGGLLLKREEFAVLPPDVTLCPVCRNEDLPPYDVRTFLYLLSRCLFCNTCFGVGTTWVRGWSTSWHPTIDRIGEVEKADQTLCPLCGRNDVLDREKQVVVSGTIDSQGLEATRSIPVAQYLRMAELGRILILEKDDTEAFNKTFETWFEPYGRSADTAPGLTVSETSARLLAGTLRLPTRRVLQKRLELFHASWERKLPAGLGYHVAGTIRERERE